MANEGRHEAVRELSEFDRVFTDKPITDRK